MNFLLFLAFCLETTADLLWMNSRNKYTFYLERSLLLKTLIIMLDFVHQVLKNMVTGKQPNHQNLSFTTCLNALFLDVIRQVYRHWTLFWYYCVRAGEFVNGELLNQHNMQMLLTTFSFARQPQPHQLGWPLVNTRTDAPSLLLRTISFWPRDLIVVGSVPI